MGRAGTFYIRTPLGVQSFAVKRLLWLMKTHLLRWVTGEMSDQVPLAPVTQVPVWLQAAGWGLLSAFGLLIGAVAGYYASQRHASVARAMTFAAGVLLALVAVDLIIDSREVSDLHWTVVGLLGGAAVFSSANWLLSRYGARHRKRCGECVEQPTEEVQPGSGLAIAVGTLLDGVPEGVVLGMGMLHHGAPAIGTVVAIFLGNIPEALSSSAGMRRAGRSGFYVFGLWLGISLMIGLATVAATLFFEGTVASFRGTTASFAAGAILALVSETMIPEAFHGTPEFNGLLLVVGFAALLVLMVLGR
jgi:ZIP family zinc transporter